jgi:hypothetical protein
MKEMMYSFTYILQQLPMEIEASSTSSHFRGMIPLNVQVNFDIPLFEGYIDAYTLEKWLNLLEGYYSIQKFSDGEKITFTLLKSLPHVRSWCEGYYDKYTMDTNIILGREPT